MSHNVSFNNRIFAVRAEREPDGGIVRCRNQSNPYTFHTTGSAAVIVTLVHRPSQHYEIRTRICLAEIGPEDTPIE
jgi:hypothetical protein